MDMEYPAVSEERAAALQAYRSQLLAD
jgi:hypothetical protein